MEELSGKCAECERLENQRQANMNLCRRFNERENSLLWQISINQKQMESAIESIKKLEIEIAKLRGHERA